MSRPWTLKDWLAPWVESSDERSIGPPSLDSRRVADGGVFLACCGEHHHGAVYLDDAIARGARAVVWEPAAGVDGEWVSQRCAHAGVTVLAVDDLASRAGELAARYYGHPAHELTLIGVTGTDGKTSVTQFLARALGGPAGDGAVIGTLGWGSPDELAESELTTPDAVTLQAWLACLRDRGASAVAMEVSSHALAQERVSALAFDAAVLTNLGHDHLDYHGSLNAYRAAKRRLFDLGTPVPVLNLDDTWGAALADELAPRSPVGYAMTASGPARVRCHDFRPESGAMGLDVGVDDRVVTLHLPLVGRFNALNVLATAGALTAVGIPASALAQRLGRIRPVAGRMEPVAHGEGPSVVVDYAHTPGALASALAAVREHCAGQLWLVFGCGGDRDPAKRPLMGRIAAQEADRVVLTNDNPRHEDPLAIIRDIQEGMGGEGAVITDRRRAIREVIASARGQDCVLIAGKGHEGWQDNGDRRERFSDRDEARAALEEAV